MHVHVTILDLSHMSGGRAEVGSVFFLWWRSGLIMAICRLLGIGILWNWNKEIFSFVCQFYLKNLCCYPFDYTVDYLFLSCCAGRRWAQGGGVVGGWGSWVEDPLPSGGAPAEQVSQPLSPTQKSSLGCCTVEMLLDVEASLGVSPHWFCLSLSLFFFLLAFFLL